MKSLVTDVHNYHRNIRKIIKFLVFLIFIEIFLTSIVVSQPDNEIQLPENLNNNNNSNGINIKTNLKHHKYNSTSEHWKSLSKKGKRVRKHRKHQIKYLTEENSNEDSLLFLKNDKEPHPSFIDPTKQYFDYYPVEKVDVKYDPRDDDNIHVVLLSKIKSSEYDGNSDYAFGNDGRSEEIIKKRRSKRHTKINKLSEKSLKRQKRNANYLQEFLNYEQQPTGSGYQYEIPPQGLRRNNLKKLPSSGYNGNYYTYGTPNDPWNIEYNRFYANLPRLPPTSIGGFLKYPIRGIYYNPISPSGIWQPLNRPDTVGTPEDPDFFENRFDGDPDLPVWNQRPNINNRPTTRPNFSPNQQPQSTSPPLIHKPKSPLSSSSSASSSSSSSTSSGSSGRRPTQRPLTRPQENLPQNNDRAPNRGGGFIGSSNSISDTQPAIQQPSKCVWAIVTCCSRNNLDVRYSCFEQMGCYGAFWDLNPCADANRRIAVAEASKFLD